MPVTIHNTAKLPIIAAAMFVFVLMTADAASAQIKRNNRPDAPKSTPEAATKAHDRSEPTHFYEFSRPGFSYSKVSIKHDDSGVGSITFLKDGYDETITEPVALSQVTIGKISDALTTLRFLDSTEEYQFTRDYSHLGNATFTLKRDGRSRSVKYNWTENLAARSLLDEYRRIGNEYTWAFEISVARQNMPLQTPGLMDTVESYLQRNEISDPRHLVPFLTELSTDERLPLMARNKAVKLIKNIEKQKK